jgi:predicted RNase H-like nuclease (RuvC/YqgF family)
MDTTLIDMSTGHMGVVAVGDESGADLKRENERLSARVEELESALAETERELESAHEWVAWVTEEVEDAECRIEALETALEAERERDRDPGFLARLARVFR